MNENSERFGPARARLPTPPVPLPRESSKIFGIMAEAVAGFEQLAPLQPCAGVFGSARIPPGHPYYALTEPLARRPCAVRPMRLCFVLLLVPLALGGRLALAQTDREPLPPPPPPAEEERAAPPADDPGAFEPEVRITTRGTEIHEEYRYNGSLYRVKVTPRYGPPYYLLYDEQGNVRRSDAEPKLLVPQWVIKRF